MEFIEGCKISDLKTLREQKFNLKDINTKLFKIFGHQIFSCGFVHGDPHAGNSELFMWKLDAIYGHPVFTTLCKD